MHVLPLCIVLLFAVACAEGEGRKNAILRSRYARRYAKKVLKVHNYYRGIHKAFPLTLNAKLNTGAMECARNLAGLETTYKENPLKSQFQGQNVAIWCSTKARLSAKSAVNMWYDEVCRYNFYQAKWNPLTQHFTQMVWRSTRKLGVGVAYNNSCTYVVARYSPSGNTPGLFTKNVRKGKFNRRKTCGDNQGSFWFFNPQQK